jgi:hypothetical protein
MTRSALKKMLKNVPLPCTIEATETSEGLPMSCPQKVYLQTPSDVKNFTTYANIKLAWYVLEETPSV